MFIKNFNNINLLTNKYKNINPKCLLSGAEIGVPLNIFSDIFTQIHYGKNILNQNTIILQFLLGYYAYGIDRYKDALEYKQENNNINYPDSKINLYNNVLKYKNLYSISLILSLIGSVYIINSNGISNLNYFLIPQIILIQFYKELKPLLSYNKPLFISFMWTFCSIFIPCYLYENNFDIINYPNDYLPCFLILFATSNYADIKDLEEDKQNNILTFPVLIGEKKSNLLSFAIIVLASLLYTESTYFNQRPIIDTILEFQNFGLMYLTYNNTF